MGLYHERAHGSLRFSLGKWTIDEEIERGIAWMTSKGVRVDPVIGDIVEG
ncbi:hypothetical protein ES703_124255 [subsurface metagenome]